MPTETPREPDRYETATDALERIARAFDANPTAQHSGAAVASILRYLAHEPPAAAPAASQCEANPDHCEKWHNHAPPTEPVAPVAPARQAVETVLELAEKWAGGSRRDSEAFDVAAPIVRALVAFVPAQRAEARIAELERRVEAGLRIAKYRYRYWATSGGGPECAHGINLGIHCARCDMLTLETGAARTSQGGAGEGTT